MHTTWFNLAWKEWHEHKWKLAALVATMWSVAGLILHEADVWTLDGVRVTMVMCIVPLSIFIGMGTAAGERSRGTIRFLQALPVPMWRVSVNKLLLGIATIVAATMLTLGFVSIWCRIAGIEYNVAHAETGPFTLGLSNWFLNTAVPVLYVAISFYIWAAACGVNRKDEVRAGAVALLIMAIWSAVMIYWTRWLDLSTVSVPAIRGTAIRVAAIALSTIPGGLLHVTELNTTWGLWDAKENLLWLGAISAVVTHLALIAWFIARFGRISNLEIRSAQTAQRSANQFEWLGPPRRSPLTAIAWKQLREAGPIALAGLAGIIAIIVIAQITTWGELGRVSKLGDVYTVTATTVGFVIALIIGLGVAYYDVQPQIVTFWRSRPIHPDLWFWCKFATGITVLLATIYAPIFLIAALGDSSGLEKFHPADAILVSIAQVAVFASAVAMLCLTRHAIYAAILSIAFMYSCIFLVLGAWYVAGLVGWTEPQTYFGWQPRPIEWESALITSCVASTALAWLSMRYDWGHKSRY